MSDLCKFLKKYDVSKDFLKKSLQYIWFDNDPELESDVYEKLGVLYFLQGNIEKAKEFHER